MAFTTSGQEMEWAYSYSPGAHTGQTAGVDALPETQPPLSKH